jgi:DNA-binding LytR/AlgR family response regulator
MPQVLIIEDEPIAAENLASMLKKIDSNLHLKAQIDSVEDSITWLQVNTADLIFLDIHLADGLAFNIFEQVDVNIPIIFTTAYNQYAIKAFKLNSLDYLLKPIDENELRQAIEKFKKISPHFVQNFDLKSLLSSFQNQTVSYQKRFMVTAGEKVKSVLCEEIAYFLAEGRYIFLVCHDNRRYIIDYTLDKLEEMLDPDAFIRINRQFLVSFKAIKEMFSYPKGRIKINLTPPVKEEVIVSLSKAIEFKKWLNR